MDNSCIFSILTTYINSNGIKPDSKNAFDINDDEITMINKFNIYYFKCHNFACGDGRDMIGFIRINKNFIDTTYMNIIKDTELENDPFIKHMLYHISSNKNGSKYIYPNIIININFINSTIDDGLIINIYNMNNDIITDLLVNKKITINKLYDLICSNDVINSKYRLYDITQLKILNNTVLIPLSNKILDEFISENKIHISNLL